MSNESMNIVRNNPQDEFYTMMSDIESELEHYKSYFKDKIVYCNCDDICESNFPQYFIDHFNDLGLKELITTNYIAGKIRFQQTNLFGDKVDGEYRQKVPHKRRAYQCNITHVPKESISIRDLVKLDGNSIIKLENGSFDSQECVKNLIRADVVVTNPPFSLFRDFVGLLEKHRKNYLIIGNVNAITYKEIFPLIKDKRLWLGYTQPKQFIIPAGETTSQVLGLCRWFTNIDTDMRHQPMELTATYTPEAYPKFDRYDVINVGRTCDIPLDYYGVMAVPITFLDKYCPDQFEVIGTIGASGQYDVGEPVLNGETTFKRILVRRNDKNQNAKC